MPAKKRATSAGLIAGLIRKSDVPWPEGCDTPAARAAHLDELRALRRAELAADAARDNLAIDVWYDDMSVSGRGQFLDKREGFLSMWQHAKEGKLRIIYTRDISRVGRDFLYVETFFVEMESLGVIVRVSDLPAVAENERAEERIGRNMLRRILASVAQARAETDGVTIRRTQQERVRAGLWVGGTRNMWGLKYNKQTKGYDLDPATLPLAVTLYEAFVAADGIAGRAAAALNRDGPRCRTGAPWTSSTLLTRLRCTAYRRIARRGDVSRSLPELIPESIPVEIVAEVDRLLALRACPWMGPGPRRIDYTYSGLVTCGHCGARVRAHGSVEINATGGRYLRPAYYRCKGINGPPCAESFTLTAGRLDILVGQALQEAVSAYAGDLAGPTASAAGRAPRRRTKEMDPFTELRSLDVEEARCKEVYKRGVGTIEELVADMERLSARRKALRSQISVEPAAERGSLTSDECRVLLENLARVWSSSGEPDLSNMAKHNLLRELGAAIVLTIPVMTGRTHPPKPDDNPGAAAWPANPRRTSGPAEVTIMLPALGGATATASETWGAGDRRPPSGYIRLP